MEVEEQVLHGLRGDRRNNKKALLRLGRNLGLGHS